MRVLLSGTPSAHLLLMSTWGLRWETACKGTPPLRYALTLYEFGDRSFDICIGSVIPGRSRSASPLPRAFAVFCSMSGHTKRLGALNRRRQRRF